LLDEGATVPFISRYRKEATGGLDDTQLRLLEDRLRYLRKLEERREAIIESITEAHSTSCEIDIARSFRIYWSSCKLKQRAYYLCNWNIFDVAGLAWVPQDFR
jgi:hypothetical protein